MSHEMHHDLDEGDDHDNHADHAKGRNRPHSSNERDEEHNSHKRQNAIAMKFDLRPSSHVVPRGLNATPGWWAD